MRLNPPFSTILPLTFIVYFLAQAKPQVTVAAPAATFSPDARGLEKQFEPFLKAYASGDTAKLDQKFAIFALPDASGWFAKYFAKDQVQQLVWDNEAEVAVYEESLVTTMKRWPEGTHFRLHASQNRPKSPPTIRPRPDATLPLVEVPIEQYHLNFVADKVPKGFGRGFSELENYVYVNGAYRYVGGGAYPFWSMPDATGKSNP